MGRHIRLIELNKNLLKVAKEFRQLLLLCETEDAIYDGRLLSVWKNHNEGIKKLKENLEWLAANLSVRD